MEKVCNGTCRKYRIDQLNTIKIQFGGISSNMPCFGQLVLFSALLYFSSALLSKVSMYRVKSRTARCALDCTIIQERSVILKKIKLKINSGAMFLRIILGWTLLKNSISYYHDIIILVEFILQFSRIILVSILDFTERVPSLNYEV